MSTHNEPPVLTPEALRRTIQRKTQEHCTRLRISRKLKWPPAAPEIAPEVVTPLEPTHFIPLIAELRGLLHLEIDGYNLDSDALLRLATLEHLRTLNLLACTLPPQALTRFRSLHSLHSLSLAQSSLYHQDIPSIAEIPALENLDLSSIVITQDDLAGLSNCRGLRSLTITKGAFELRHIVTLSNLEKLCLPGVGITSTAPISDLPQLHTLDISRNPLSEWGISHNLAKLKKLSTLHLRNCGLTDDSLDIIGRIQSLKQLNIGDNPIDKIDETANLKQLEYLFAISTPASERNIKTLSGLPCLHDLSLGGRSEIAGSITEHQGFEALRVLSIYGRITPRTFIDIHKCRELRKISCYSSEALDASTAAQLARSQSLRELHLASPGLTAEVIAALTNAQRLEVLSIGKCDPTPGALTGLEKLRSLSWLSIYGATVNSEDCRSISKLRELRHLRLPQAGVDDQGARLLSQLKKLETLDLSHNRITSSGVEDFADLSSLQTLNISGNDIGDDGAERIAAIGSLMVLQIPKNGLGPRGGRALGRLENLAFLDIGQNRIGPDGCDGLSHLRYLERINIPGNAIGDRGIKSILRIPGLEDLSAAQNQISDKGTADIPSGSPLRSIFLSHNPIGDAGVSHLARLAGIRSLHLTNCNIGNAGAHRVATMTHLAYLDLGENFISESGVAGLADLYHISALGLAANTLRDGGVAALLGRLANDTPKYLQTLDIRANGISLLPQEILETRDALAIIAAYRRLRTQPPPLNEGKLIVVGNEAVGKTSIVRALTTGAHCNASEPKTLGIAAHEKIETTSWCPAAFAPTLNIWDFGGQEIMHETHKFFLTSRSLYLLVLEDRREDDESVHLWLRTITSISRGSPVLIAINKCDSGRPRLALDEHAISTNWPNVTAIIRTSCTGSGFSMQSIDMLRNEIIRTLTHDRRLKHIRDPFPESWRQVKDNIARSARTHKLLHHSEYVDICRTAGVCDESEQRGLLQLLHDLGSVIAHTIRADGPAVLREVRLLDPNWLTTAVYSILNSELVATQDGVLRRDQMSDILDNEEYPPSRWEYILSMMQQRDISLCFRLSGSEQEEYLVPSALPKNTPDLSAPLDSLRFRFRYALLPAGLIPRFLVQAHLRRTTKRWRTGAVLEVAGCSVLLSGDRSSRVIDICVSGPQGLRRGALQVILEDLNSVHKFSPECGPTALVPLPDNLSQSEDYGHLLRLESLEGPDYRYLPVGADRYYSVRELLEGLRSQPGPSAGSSSSQREPDHPIASPDVLLVVATPVEFNAVKEAAGVEYTEVFGDMLTYYDFGMFGNARVFVVETASMGSSEPGAMHATVADAIRELRLTNSQRSTPAHIIAVGIAYGVDATKQRIGDVLVATHIRNYEPQRVGSAHIVPRGSRVPTSIRIQGRLRSASRRIRDIQVSFGVLLSGEKLVDNLGFRTLLGEIEPEALGGEMEAAGLVAACHERVAHWIVVKAICDWADGNKSENKAEHQTLAARSAACLVFEALRQNGFCEATK